MVSTLRSYRFWTVEALEDLKKIRDTWDDFVTYCLDGQYYPLKEYLDVVPEDRETAVSIPLPQAFLKAELASLNEHTLEALPIENGCIKLHFAPYKALTLKLLCK